MLLNAVRLMMSLCILFIFNSCNDIGKLSSAGGIKSYNFECSKFKLEEAINKCLLKKTIYEKLKVSEYDSLFDWISFRIYFDNIKIKYQIGFANDLLYWIKNPKISTLYIKFINDTLNARRFDELDEIERISYIQIFENNFIKELEDEIKILPEYHCEIVERFTDNEPKKVFIYRGKDLVYEMEFGFNKIIQRYEISEIVKADLGLQNEQ